MESYKLALAMLASAEQKKEDLHELCPENMMDEMALNIGHEMDGFIEVLMMLADMAETDFERNYMTAIAEKVNDIKYSIWT